MKLPSLLAPQFKLQLVSAFLALTLPVGAFAALGGSVSSVEQDKTHMKAALRNATDNIRYTVHEMHLASGTVIHEYASPDGKIFAVAWTGPVLPDLRQLLGDYFLEYNDAAAQKHAGHNRLTVQRPAFVMHSSGHMRSYSGKAYVPQLLPPNVSVDEIR